MPRKRRVEYAGAVYHVISRGNYRKELFLDRDSGKRFEDTLFEVVDRCGWKVYAYVIMKNHFHIAMETPEPNLVAGMKWLQGTFATRFNRYHKECGHVFQGRYKAILVGSGRPLLGLVNYIHLNPVRAGICPVETLKQYPLSSYPKYWRKWVRKGLDRATVLSLIGASDNVAGMRKYQMHLELNEAKEPEERERLWKQYCRGWFIGPDKEKHELAKEIAKAHRSIKWELAEYAELNQANWETIVEEELRKQKKSEQDLTADAKGALYKVKIALKLRKETTAGNPWIAHRLKMGHPSRVTALISQLKNN